MNSADPPQSPTLRPPERIESVSVAGPRIWGSATHKLKTDVSGVRVDSCECPGALVRASLLAKQVVVNASFARGASFFRLRWPVQNSAAVLPCEEVHRTASRVVPLIQS